MLTNKEILINELEKSMLPLDFSCFDLKSNKQHERNPINKKLADLRANYLHKLHGLLLNSEVNHVLI